MSVQTPTAYTVHPCLNHERCHWGGLVKGIGFTQRHGWNACSEFCHLSFNSGCTKQGQGPIPLSILICCLVQLLQKNGFALGGGGGRGRVCVSADRWNQQLPFSNSAGKPSIISQDPSFVRTSQEKTAFQIWGMETVSSKLRFLANQSSGVSFSLPRTTSQTSELQLPLKPPVNISHTLFVLSTPFSSSKPCFCGFQNWVGGNQKEKSIAMFLFNVMLDRTTKFSPLRKGPSNFRK